MSTGGSNYNDQLQLHIIKSLKISITLLQKDQLQLQCLQNQLQCFVNGNLQLFIGLVKLHLKKRKLHLPLLVNLLHFISF